MTRNLMVRQLLLGVSLALLAVPAAAAAQAVAAPARAQEPAPIIVIDGVVLSGGTGDEQKALMKAIEPAIQSIEVVQGQTALTRYGERARGGVILITLKSEFKADAKPAADAAAAVVPRTRATTVAPRGVVEAEARPLFIVDGVILPDIVANNIKPGDIESIEVIKGAAAAALYGARATNGVVSITTKKR
jgi:TonB-dependent SusC/RagA subfamily outer membrane receptor